MAINFPNNPSINDEYTSGSNTWIWSGIAWNLKPPGSNLNDLSDVNVTGVTDGQVLYYNSTTGNWEAVSLSSSFNGGTITSPLNIQNSSASSNITSGALIVLGGVGIGGAIHIGSTATVGGALTVSSGGANVTGNSTVTGSLTVTSTGSFASNLTIRSASELRLNDNDNTNYIAFRAPANVTSNVTYQLPAADGVAGYVLSTNGAGSLSWVQMSGGGGGGSSNPPGGSSGNVQFNNNGTFGGVASFNYDQLTDTLEAFNISIGGNIQGGTDTSISSIKQFAFKLGPAIDEFSTDDTMIDSSNTAVPTEAAVKTYVDNNLALKADIDNPTFTGTVNGITKSMVGLGNVENTALSTWTGSSSITTVGTLTNLSVAGNITTPTKPTIKTHVTNKEYVDTRAIAMSIAMS